MKYSDYSVIKWPTFINMCFFMQDIQRYITLFFIATLNNCRSPGISEITWTILPFITACSVQTWYVCFCELFLAVGKPVQVEKVENPSQEDIDNLHAVYVEALVELFKQNKTKYGVDDSVDMHIVEWACCGHRLIQLYQPRIKC